MLTIVLKPEPLLHQLEHVTALHLGVLLRDGLLQLGEVTLPAVAAYTRLTVVLAALPGSANELLGRDHQRLNSRTTTGGP